jgi:hypothetical protein
MQEFSAACGNYYRLTVLLAEQELHFETLLRNALPYTGQTDLKELDRIIRCNRKVQAARADADKIEKDLRDVQWQILQMMRYFEITPNTRLSGEIPDEKEFEIWADEDNMIHCKKTTDITPPADNANIIEIKLRNRRGTTEEEDEDE